MKNSDELIRLTATEAVARLRKREISPLELIDAAAARIEAVDAKVNALPIRFFDVARTNARRFMAKKPPEDPPPGWLAGLPLAAKDYNDVAGQRTTYGSPIFAESIATANDHTVTTLEASGAIFMAKTNVPEFAGSNTFNPVFGATRNPWDLNMTAGGEHLAADPRFASVSGRASHYDEIYSKLDDLLAERTTSEWVDLLSANDIPCMKVAGLMDLLSDPQVAAAGLIEEHVHPSEGRIRGTRVPARWSEADLSMRLHAPRLGEHSIEVLLEAGLSQRQIDELVAAGVTLASPDAQEREARQ